MMMHAHERFLVQSNTPFPVAVRASILDICLCALDTGFTGLAILIGPQVVC